MKYFIKTYGCQMNVHESEKLAGMLVSLGYSETTKMEEADVIVFNTCCIRDGAEQKVYGNISMTKNLKKKNPNLIVAICGCMTQASGRAETLKKKYPYVNIVFGTHNLHEFKKYLEEYKSSNKNVYCIWDKEQGINEEVEMYRTSGNNAWVNIMYGCNNFCTYCIVPYVRGRERSKPMQDIINEVTMLANEGYKYITLLGQNVNSYGNDLEDPNVTFANLLKELCKIDGDFKIKFMTSHPKDLNDEVIEAIAQNDKLAKVIHLPVQSGSNPILKAMNRRYTIEHYLGLIDKIRSKIKNCYISTDIIVGFPGETEEDFNNTYNLVEKVKYDGVFAFMYSKRSGTVAEKMENQIPDEIKNERVNKLLKLSKQITKDNNYKLVGEKFNVIVVKELKNNTYIAETDSGKSLEIITEKKLLPNTFVDVLIENFSNNKLHAKLI